MTTVASTSALLDHAGVVPLPAPVTTGGMPLMEALAARHSTRAYDGSRDVSAQDLSNLLWSAAGHSRPFAGRGFQNEGCGAAPSAHNWQDLEVYVATARGVHLYDPFDHALTEVLSHDLRPLTSHPSQPFVVDAPVNLIYVSDTERMYDAIPWDFGVFPWANTAVAVENVYLYCASAGLSTVCRALFSRDPLTEALGLRPRQLITFHQLVGYSL